jgi:uncharacterized damage-inducible protein DinB
MHVNLDTLQTHIDYSHWANRRMLEAAKELSQEELSRDFGTADKSVLGTLLHVYGGEVVWIERVYGTSLKARPYDAHATLDTLLTAWPPVWERWRDYVAGLTPEAAEAKINYLSFKGDEFHTPVWQIILHIVNHGTHHRGQAAGFIRAIGKTPPVLDLTHYYREQR